MLDHMERILYTSEQIEQKVKQLGDQLSAAFAGEEPIFIGVLKGSFMFMSDLIKHVTVPIEIDFMSVSSYGHGTSTSGTVTIRKDLDIDVSGRDVVIVEDIIDSGITLDYLMNLFQQREAKSITLVTLFDKPSGRKVDLEPDYCGFQLPDAFVVGYGLDYAERYRNLPYLGILKPEVYNK